MKSSKQLTCDNNQPSFTSVGDSVTDSPTFRSLVPARCHSLPSSPPPRMLGTASTPLHLWTNVRMAPLKNGLMEILKPPYPISGSLNQLTHLKVTVNGPDRIVERERFRPEGYPCASL